VIRWVVDQLAWRPVIRKIRFAARPALVRPTTHHDRGRFNFFSEEMGFGKE